MTNKGKKSYLRAYAAQIGALGEDGQEKLRQAWIHSVGAGRIGSALLLFLAGAGVGHLSTDDSQTVEFDNGNSFVFRVPGDVGKPKVQVLERWIGTREHLEFRPTVLAVEADGVDRDIRSSDLVICCANTVAGRLATEQKAIRYQLPCMQVAALDAGERLGGLIAVRLPENDWSACFGCSLEGRPEPGRGASLVFTVTTALAAMAANMAVELLTGVRADVFREKNLFFFDLQNYAIEAIAVQKRSGCRLCGTAAPGGE